jgi:hypothetical protein
MIVSLVAIAVGLIHDPLATLRFIGVSLLVCVVLPALIAGALYLAAFLGLGPSLTLVLEGGAS